MNLIKECRVRCGYRQIDLAEKLGVLQSTISHWENGKVEPDSDSLIKLASIFNVSIDTLIGRNKLVPVSEQNSIMIPVFKNILVEEDGSFVGGKNILRYIGVDSHIASFDPFAFRVNDNFLYPKMACDDIAIAVRTLKSISDLISGDIVVIKLRKSLSIVRCIRIDSQSIALFVFGLKGPIEVYTREEFSKLTGRILGCVVEVRREIREI